MPSLRDRVDALEQHSTPDAQDAIRKYAFALHDPVVIEELEGAAKPLTRTRIVGAIIKAAALRHPPTNKATCDDPVHRAT
jgi:hypothetical protein